MNENSFRLPNAPLKTSTTFFLATYPQTQTIYKTIFKPHNIMLKGEVRGMVVAALQDGGGSIGLMQWRRCKANKRQRGTRDGMMVAS